MNTVAILSPGDMGHAVGQLLLEHELRVVTCLAGRSARTRALSEKAGIVDLPSLEEMGSQSDVMLPITVSESAPDVCRRVADAMLATGAKPLFGECNAVAPQLVRRMEPMITTAGGRFVDASIIGGPPRNGSSPRFYASGPHAAEFEGLREFGLDVRNIGPEIGKASGIKMCYAAMTKGSSALYTQFVVTAEARGLFDAPNSEYPTGEAPVLERGEPLRVVDASEARARREDHGGRNHGAGKRPHTGLVNAGDPADAGGPQLPLPAQQTPQPLPRPPVQRRLGSHPLPCRDGRTIAILVETVARPKI